MKGSLQSKIAIVMWSMSALSILIAVVVTSLLLIEAQRDSIMQQLKATAASIVSLNITDFSDLKDFEELSLFIENNLQLEKINTIICVYDKSRTLVFSTVGLNYDMFPTRLDKVVDKPAVLHIEGERQDYESIILPYKGNKNKGPFYLQVAIPTAKYYEILQSLWWQGMLLLFLFIAMSMVIAHVFTSRILRPVRDIADHLQEMDPVKMESWKPIELEERYLYLSAIVDSINMLAERIWSSISQIRMMSRYVAHELRTPLTILQGEAETVLVKDGVTAKDYEIVLRSSLEEVQRMSETVNTVMKLSEDADRLSSLKAEQINLVDWIKEQKNRWEKTLSRPISLELPKGFEPVVNVDPRLLFQLVDNLIRNVLKHTPDRASCSLVIRHSHLGTILALIDDGPGMPEKLLDSLNTEGSYSRLTGVGLHLCHRISHLSGIRLRFENRREGGLCAELFFAAV